LNHFLHLIIVARIRECGENPMFHLRSQLSSKTYLIVRSGWETSAGNQSVSFCDRPLTFCETQRAHNFLHTIFLSHLHGECDETFCTAHLADFGSALSFQTSHSKPVLPLSNEHNKHKNSSLSGRHRL
jgi:hypothetical protein